MVLTHNCRINILFLSTPSARRATGLYTALRLRRMYFYPRPPRGGRHATVCNDNFVIATFLSTPSARRATVSSGGQNAGHTDFYPRPPRGGRQ